MLRIHEQLMSGKLPNCSTLAGLLECSTKTVQRDLDYMRDQLGLPLEYDDREHGWGYTEAVTHFPTVPASEGELLALFVAQQALVQYRGTPFEKPLATAFAKLAEMMDDDISVDLNGLSQSLSFRHQGAGLAELEIFEQVQQALLDSRELTFRYRKLSSNRPETRRVQPYHLSNIDGQWYLFAHCHARDDLRTFVLGRIEAIVELGAPFEKPADFSLSERLLNTFGVFRGEGDFRVRIEFHGFAAQLVRERQWHTSQEIHDKPEGRIELRLRVDSLEEIERWVLSWGGQAKVVAPPQLKQRVKDALAQMNDQYAATPGWFADLREAAQIYQPDRLLSLVMAMDRGMDDPNQMELWHR